MDLESSPEYSDLDKAIIQHNVTFLKENIPNVFSERDRFVHDPVTNNITYDIVLVVDNAKICSVQKAFPHAQDLMDTKSALNGLYLIEGDKQSILLDPNIKDQVIQSSIAKFNKA